LKIRSAKKGVGAVRPRKGLQQLVPAPTVSIRKKRTRLDTVDDPVEPFSPDNTEANLDEIEVEPVPQEPSTEDPPDPAKECFEALCALRIKVWDIYIRCFLRAQIMSTIVRSGKQLQPTGYP